MISDALIKQKGFDVLRENLGLVEMQRFIMLINHDNFDYTKWHQKQNADMSIEEISREAMDLRKTDC